MFRRVVNGLPNPVARCPEARRRRRRCRAKRRRRRHIITFSRDARSPGSRRRRRRRRRRRSSPPCCAPQASARTATCSRTPRSRRCSMRWESSSPATIRPTCAVHTVSRRCRFSAVSSAAVRRRRTGRRSRSSTHSTIPTPSTISAFTGIAWACRRARARTAASRSSTQPYRRARIRCRTADGPPRRRSISRWRRPRVRPAVSR